MRKLHHYLGTTFTGAILVLLLTPNCFAWGVDGHKIVGLIADHYLTDQARAQVNALLMNDTSNLTATDIASEATWADKYRNRHPETKAWHFIDTEISDGNIDEACFSYPPLPLNTPASKGTAQDCAINKIDQFRKELENTKTEPEERLLALQFLLHLVGDMHQPLHASDDHDRGGNQVAVSAPHIRPGKLHSYWDTAFVHTLGDDPATIAQDLIAKIKQNDLFEWQQQTPRDWSLEAFALAKNEAYGKLPLPNPQGKYHLSMKYVDNASEVVALQLSRAGVRLANLLNHSLANDTVNEDILHSPFSSR